jgi:hypothetical protein
MTKDQALQLANKRLAGVTVATLKDAISAIYYDDSIDFHALNLAMELLEQRVPEREFCDFLDSLD